MMIVNISTVVRMNIEYSPSPLGENSVRTPSIIKLTVKSITVEFRWIA